MKQSQMKLLASLPQILVPWYQACARKLPWRETKDPYSVWISEIMLQQTRVEAVKQYYTRFLCHLPTIEKLANADEELLLKLWEGLGYYSRVRNLQKAAKKIMEEHGGVFPTEYRDILALPGIGEYTAGAISSICFHQPTPAVDGNVLRVVSRICAINEPITSPTFKKDVHQTLLKLYPKDCPSDFTQAFMELGATICLPNGTPLCESCPAKAVCVANKKGIQKVFPPKPLKKARRKEEYTVFMLTCGEKVAVRKRPKTGLLRDMWEFPNTSGKLNKTQALHALKDWDVTPSGILQSVSREHIFTHVEWNMTGYYFTCEEMSESFIWVTKDQLLSDIALPTAFRQFVELLPLE